MPQMDIIVCAGVTGSNTGQPTCDFTPGVNTGVLLTPAGREYTPQELATLYTVLTNGTRDNDPNKRIYPLQNAIDFEDKTGEESNETYANGTVKKIRDGYYAYGLKFESGLKFFQNVKDFDNLSSRFDILYIDTTNNAIIGRKIVKQNAVNTLGGFKLSQLNVSNYKLPTHTTSASFMLSYTLKDNRQFNSLGAAVVFDESDNVADLQGLITIDLRIITPMTTGGVVVIGANAGASDLGSVYSTNLAATAAWSAKKVDGTPIPITGAVASGGGWQLTLTTGSLPPIGEALTVGLSTNTALSAALTTNAFDKGNSLTIIRP
jgi:hypothetical protein